MIFLLAERVFIHRDPHLMVQVVKGKIVFIQGQSEVTTCLAGKGVGGEEAACELYSGQKQANNFYRNKEEQQPHPYLISIPIYCSLQKLLLYT